MSAQSGGISPKLAGAGLGAAVATIIVWIIEASYRIQLDAPIEMAIVTVVSFLVGLFVSDQTGALMLRRRDKKTAEQAAAESAHGTVAPPPS